MKEFQLDNVKYKVPTDWSEVLLSHRIKAEEDAKKLIDNPAIQKIAYISGYAGIPIEVLKKTPLKKIQKMFQHLNFLNSELPSKPITDFEFKGEKYYVMESLNRGQFQDFISCESALENNKENPIKALPIVLAILCKKEGETLDDYDPMKRAKEFEELPMSIVNPLQVFFYAIGKTSQINTVLSSMAGKQLLLNAKAAVLKNTLRQQAGMGWLRNLVRLMLLRLVKSLEKHWTKFFHSIQSKSLKTN